jgi:hypothetical protein
MNNTAFLQWSLGTVDNLIHGYNAIADTTVDQECRLGVVFPQFLSEPQALLLASGASFLPEGYAYTLKNVRFFLSGEAAAVATLLGWAPDAGAQISFDSGATWIQFGPTKGNPADSSTWIPLAGSAVSSLAPDGQILPYDVARILIRLQTPLTPESYGLTQFLLGVDFDVF